VKVIDKIYDFENGDKYVVETKECFHCKKQELLKYLLKRCFIYIRVGKYKMQLSL
jgi:hypothetical protein